MRLLIQVVASVSLCFGTIASAAAQETADYFKASQEFEQLVAQMAETRSMPRIADKKAAELIATLSDSRRFLDSTAFQLKDMNTLLDLCGKANDVAMSYALFDLKSNVDPKAEPAAATLQMARLIERNIETYQDELEQLQPFLLRCMARQIPLLNEFALSLKPEQLTDVRRDGLKKMRIGIFNIYRGVLRLSSHPKFKESYRTRMLQTLSETAGAFSSALQIPARQEILGFARPLQATAPKDLHIYLETIINAMQETSCNRLCEL